VAGGTAASNNATRTYYIAADEVDWNYAPAAHEHMTGQPYEEQTHNHIDQYRAYRLHTRSIPREPLARAKNNLRDS